MEPEIVAISTFLTFIIMLAYHKWESGHKHKQQLTSTLKSDYTALKAQADFDLEEGRL
jgi:hypothetical protein